MKLNCRMISCSSLNINLWSCVISLIWQNACERQKNSYDVTSVVCVFVHIVTNKGNVMQQCGLYLQCKCVCDYYPLFPIYASCARLSECCTYVNRSCYSSWSLIDYTASIPFSCSFLGSAVLYSNLCFPSMCSLFQCNPFKYVILSSGVELMGKRKRLHGSNNQG